MPTQHTYTTYSFSELLTEAQEKAIENTRNDEHYLHDEWWDGVYDCFKEYSAMLGFDVDLKGTYFSGFCHQGQGASFSASYEYKKGWKKEIESVFGGEFLEKLIEIGDKLQGAQKDSFYQLTANTEQWDHRTYSQRTDIEHYEYGSDGFTEDQEDLIKESIDDLAGLLYSRLEAEHDWLLSDEHVKESIISNDWQFSENGGMM